MVGVASDGPSRHDDKKLSLSHANHRSSACRRRRESMRQQYKERFCVGSDFRFPRPDGSGWVCSMRGRTCVEEEVRNEVMEGDAD